MQIKTYHIEDIQGCKVYYRCVDTLFHFILVLDGAVYERVYTVHPPVFTRLFYLLGLKKEMYSEKMVGSIIEIMRRAVTATIESVRNPKPPEPETPSDEPKA